MLKQTLRNAFDEMTTALRGIPNVTADMLIFTGHSDDIDTLDYFYYEGILPGAYANDLDAARYVLAVVLENDNGFYWRDGILQHGKYDVSVDLAHVVVDATTDDDDASSAIGRAYESITSELARRRVFGIE
ncbi:MAG: hypothetical protein KDA63_09310 [Planctomycetales bacterium]|nr:hypothetical protein [Planctomycetales bacterium]